MKEQLPSTNRNQIQVQETHTSLPANVGAKTIHLNVLLKKYIDYVAQRYVNKHSELKYATKMDISSAIRRFLEYIVAKKSGNLLAVNECCEDFREYMQNSLDLYLENENIKSIKIDYNTGACQEVDWRFKKNHVQKIFSHVFSKGRRINGVFYSSSEIKTIGQFIFQNLNRWNKVTVEPAGKDFRILENFKHYLMSENPDMKNRTIINYTDIVRKFCKHVVQSDELNEDILIFSVNREAVGAYISGYESAEIQTADAHKNNIIWGLSYFLRFLNEKVDTLKNANKKSIQKLNVDRDTVENVGKENLDLVTKEVFEQNMYQYNALNKQNVDLDNVSDELSFCIKNIQKKIVKNPVTKKEQNGIKWGNITVKSLPFPYEFFDRLMNDGEKKDGHVFVHTLSARARAFFVLGYLGGLRVESAMHVKVGDINWEEKNITITKAKGMKDNDRKLLRASELLLNTLKELIREGGMKGDDYFFPNSRNRSSYGTTFVRKNFEKLGVHETTLKNSKGLFQDVKFRMTFHSLRRAFADNQIKLLQKEHDERVSREVQKMIAEGADTNMYADRLRKLSTKDVYEIVAERMFHSSAQTTKKHYLDLHNLIKAIENDEVSREFEKTYNEGNLYENYNGVIF